LSSSSSSSNVGGGGCFSTFFLSFFLKTKTTGPYLIADGGNVSVESVDEKQRLVVLKLQGACGSCASSTITMQMGIERVLKEKWADVSIVQAEDDKNENGQPNELQWQAVETEMNRLRPALRAMGSTVALKSVDAATGNVVIQYTGSSKVRQGLELAIVDVPLVQKVTFVEE
jgi:NFU1 iron-sulfur cluster scaffold homolog, mitochondrial